ncbi:MAG: metallophosphoesterase [Chitinophagaceae bacterium]|nr:metallophosphoesterase [Chitinophagaceae bacterium]
MNTARIILFFIVLALAEYYSFIVLKSALRSLPNTTRNILLGAYVLIDILCWGGFFLMRSGVVNIPQGIKTVYIALAIGLMVSKVLILVIMLGDDARRGVLWIMDKVKSEPAPTVATATDGISRSMFLSRVALFLGAGVIVGFINGIGNRYKYQIKKVKIKFPNLPKSFNGLKIVQISDIHSGSFDNQDAVNKGVQMVLEQKPDIIFFTGDLVNDRSSEMEHYQKIFAQLKAPMGVYSILGNHDYGDYVQWPSPESKLANLQELKNTHAAMGWRLMMNEHLIFERGTDKIALLGIENWGAKAHFPKYGSMKDAYAGLPEKNIPFKILLSHDPSHWTNQVRPEYQDIDLTLSGHTHGMQFGIEIPWLKWSPVQYIYKYWAGLYSEGKQYLYVNRGFGFLGYQGRFGILPEITVIELQS